MAEHGLADKLMPPNEAIAEQAEAAHRKAIREWVDRIARRTILDPIVDVLTNETHDEMLDVPATRLKRRGQLGKSVAGWITESYEQDRAIYWRRAIDKHINGSVHRAHKQQLRPRFVELLGDLTEDDGA